MRKGSRLRRLTQFAVLVLLFGGRASAAEVPAHLPRYDLDITVDTAARKATLRERVTWTNHTKSAVNHVAFNFYPNYRVPKGDYLPLA